MLVRDVEKKLDMRIVLKLRQETDFFRDTASLGRTLPVYIYNNEATTWMSTYFPKDEKSPKIDLLTRKFEAIKKEGSYVVDTRINNVKDLAIIDKLMDVPSFVINRSDMGDGFLNVYARFHSSRMDSVSQLLADYTSDADNARVAWLGPSPGITTITDWIHDEYPLSLVTYKVSTDSDDESFRRLSEVQGLIGEVRNSRNRKGKISTVLYTERPLEEGIPGVLPVSSSDCIYQFEFFNSFHSMIREKANREHIMRSRFFLKHSTDAIELNVFLPRASVYEYTSILYGIARQTSHKVMIKYVLPYSQDIWEFI